MQSQASFRRFAAICAILSAPLACASLSLSVAAVDFDFEALSRPLLLLQSGPKGAWMWRWSMLFDLFGYYALIVPLTVCLAYELRRQAPGFAELAALGLLAYSLIGSLGATMMSSMVPPMILDYSTASAPRREMLEISFLAASNMIYSGLWGLLEQLFGGLGWIGVGTLLLRDRSRWRGFGGVSVALGCSSLLDSAGTLLQLEPLSMLGLNSYAVLAPAWALLLGINLLRSSPRPPAGASAAAPH